MSTSFLRAVEGANVQFGLQIGVICGESGSFWPKSFEALGKSIIFAVRIKV